MPDATLPSYQEATRTVDWLELVGPSISIWDYARLCRVSRHFCDYFLPRLWTDPFAVCYALEPTPSFGGKTIPKIELFLRIVPHARPSTRSLVLAFRPRARDWLNLNQYGVVDSDTWSPSSSFPNLRCMTMIDDTHDPGGHADIIQYSPSQFPNNLWVMAARRCFRLVVHWPAPKHLENVVYYDDSRIHQFHSSEPRFKGMHRLRILKVAGHNMGDEYALQIVQDFQCALWSLDLSNNRLTDRFLCEVTLGRSRSQYGTRRWRDGFCICIARGHRRELEGFLCTKGFGGFFVHETPWTEDLRLYHPQRYHEDSPGYVRGDNSEDGINAECPDARKTALDDSLDAVVKAICSQKDVSLIKSLDICQLPLSGITHLYLNENPKITIGGFMSVMFGFPQLQRFECDSMLFIRSPDMFRHNQLYYPSQAVPTSVSCSKDQAISGILGLSHLIRPVFSNLQILRIHHSLVTNLPSLTGFDDMSDMEKIWFAETFLLPRADLVYPNPFHPDMNPRLRSLTLTHIPRYSTGPLIERLKGLLKAAWFQEQTISKLRAEYHRDHQARYQPPLLSGLRKIVLEFGPDPWFEKKQGKDQTGFESFDAEALLNSGAKKEFGTFGGFTTSSNGNSCNNNTRHNDNGTRGPSTVRHVNANHNGSTGSGRQQPQHGSDDSELDRPATETSGVRAAVQQSQHEQRPQEVERQRVQHSGRRIEPLYVTYTAWQVGKKIKVFVGYRYASPGQDDGGQSQQPVSVSVSRSSNSADGNGASSSGQAPAVQNFFDLLQSSSRPEERVGEESRMPSSSSSSPASPPTSTPGSSSSIPPDDPPPYTPFSLGSLIPGTSSASASLPPLLPTSTPTNTSSSSSSSSRSSSGSTTPTPSSSRGTFTTSTLPPPSSSSPRAITPIPPCFSSFPYYLSPAEQQASLTTYHRLITRVLSTYLGPDALSKAFDTSAVYNPVSASTSASAATSASASAATSASASAAAKAKQSGRNGRNGRNEKERGKQMDLNHDEVLELFDPVVAATPSMVRVGVPTQEGGRGAGCHVFWGAWKAGLFGDFFFPDHGSAVGDGAGPGSDKVKGSGSGSSPGSGSRRDGHAEMNGSGGHDDDVDGVGKKGTEESGPQNGSRSRGRNRDLLRKDMRRPTCKELAQMKDVLEELKKFRQLTGGTATTATSHQTQETKRKDKGKGKAVDLDEDEDNEEDEDEDTKWAGKHWTGELQVIRDRS